MSFRKRLAVGAGSAILVLALGAAALSQVNTGAPESATTTTHATDASGSSDRGAGSQRVNRLRESLEDLVTDGTLTAAQADTVAEHLAEVATGRGNDPTGHGDLGIDLDVAAEAIGIEPSALTDAIDNGQTIAEVADANGTDAEAVIDALVAAEQDELDELVADGSITAEVAAERAATALDRITDVVNGAIDPRSDSGSRSDGPADGPGERANEPGEGDGA
jgi:hypothetical protein